MKKLLTFSFVTFAILIGCANKPMPAALNEPARVPDPICCDKELECRKGCETRVHGCCTGQNNNQNCRTKCFSRQMVCIETECNLCATEIYCMNKFD